MGLYPHPPGVFSAIVVRARVPAGTVTVIFVGDTTVNVVAYVAPNLIAVVSRSVVPVSVTTVPTGPLAGEKDVIIGGTLKNWPLPLWTVPSGVATRIFAFAGAPSGTTAVIWVGESTVNDAAGTVPNLTALAPVKLLPVMTTCVPGCPLSGVKELIMGPSGGVVNFSVLVAVPPGVVTEIATSADSPAGADVVISVSETTVNEDTSVVPNFTDVASVRLVPLIVTAVPAAPDVGVNDPTVGIGGVVNSSVLVSVPSGVVTEIVDCGRRPAGAVVVIVELSTTSKSSTSVVPN